MTMLAGRFLDYVHCAHFARNDTEAHVRFVLGDTGLCLAPLNDDERLG